MINNKDQTLSQPLLKSPFTLGGYLPLCLGQEEEPSLQNDEEKMKEVLKEGMKNACIASPNPSVGCLITRNNKTISSGATEAWGNRHAERVAFDKLTKPLEGNEEVYVSLEPCSHQGKQPPCTNLFQTNLKRVIIACRDPFPLVDGIKELEKLGHRVTCGVLENEAKAWHLPFLVEQTFKRPFIALKWAQSEDGCLARDDGSSKWISSPTSRRYAHWLRQKYDAIMVGAQTVLTDNPRLNARDCYLSEARNPIKIIFDPKGLILQREDSEGIQAIFEGEKVVLLTSEDATSQAPALWVQKLLDQGQLTLLKDKNWIENFREKILTVLPSLSFLKGKPLQSLLVEGGARLLSLFIEQKAYDAKHVFIAPKKLDGTQYQLPLSYSGPRLGLDTLLTHERIENDILLECVTDTVFNSIFR